MSLTAKLDTIGAGAERNIAPVALKQMHQATEERQNSGILDEMIRPGQPQSYPTR
ncbi:MAG: hypothetical protein JJ957_16095 [Pseudomonadales bacterium]|nr:hypothetical protein [Pseudomonadales bacterium]MBO6563160.1 hypothetical protein [Pseudomonadales bacterium]MBO6597309.1 hypothetical protein [Pseudomonadales bacterium]MBO6824509.1 hypothetical protein [Pseudomonadales bacterium]